MLPTLQQHIVTDILRNKRFTALAVIYFIGVSLVFTQITHALFTDSASSNNNTFTAAAVFPTQAPLTAPAGSVVINELMWMSSSISPADEWIELRNTTSNTYDMTGWKLIGAANNDITIPSGTLQPNGYFLIANYDENNASSRLNITPDYVTTNLQLDNTGLKIYLANPANDITDIADDGFGIPLAGSSVSPEKSMERNSVPGDGGQAGNWHSATTATNLDASISDLATPRSLNQP